MNRILRNRLALSVLLCVTFVTGALVGAAGDRVLHAGEAGEHRGHPRKGEGGRHRTWALLEGLDLSAEQRTRIDAVLERRQPRIDALWDSVKPRLRAQVDSTHAEIRLLLAEPERDTFDRRVEEHANRHRRRAGDGREKPGP